MKGHTRYMVIAGAAGLVGLLLFGVSVTEALLWAFVLVCPVMLIVMLFTMRAEEHQHGPADRESGAHGNRTPEHKTFGPRYPHGRLRG